MTGLRSALRRPLEGVETWLDRVFGPDNNPLAQLGALGWFFYWIVAVSGIYLFVFFDTGVEQAWASLERITHVQWYAGGVMRSLHRYASDALVIVVLVHLAREWINDRMRGVRWFAWVTGVPMLWLIFASGISGYWLVWDRLAQWVAVSMSGWLDSLGIFGEPIARNFVDNTALTGRFFTLMVFIHIAVPLMLLFIMWLHIHRNAHAKVNPPRALAGGTLLAMVALSLVHPALSHAPADLDTVPQAVHPDWFYLAPLPLLDHVPGGLLWVIVGAATLGLLALPWLPPKRLAPAARVDLANCNGCARCFADCPFTAITMQERSDGLPYMQEAVVNPDLCTRCGICAGACPTSTPFRRATALVPGIELPAQPVAALRERTLAASAELAGPGRILVFGCEPGTDRAALAGTGAALVEVPCVGALPPSFIDLVLSRRLADGVLLAGCREGGCHHRLGIELTRQRFSGLRDPYLRGRVPRERLAVAWVGQAGGRALRAACDGLHQRLAALGVDAPRALPARGNRQAGVPVEERAGD